MKATKLSLQTTQFSILSKFRVPSIADGFLFSENSQTLGPDVNLHKLSVSTQHSVGIAQTLAQVRNLHISQRHAFPYPAISYISGSLSPSLSVRI